MHFASPYYLWLLTLLVPMIGYYVWRTLHGRCAGSRAGRRAPPPQSPHLLRGISRLRKFPKHPGQTPGTGSPPQNVSLRENP